MNILLISILLMTAVYLVLNTRKVEFSFTITLILGVMLSVISTICLWLNYKESFSKQDGIAISNKISYWIISDNVVWSGKLFWDYFIYSLIVTITLLLFLLVNVMKLRKQLVN